MARVVNGTLSPAAGRDVRHAARAGIAARWHQDRQTLVTRRARSASKKASLRRKHHQ